MEQRPVKTRVPDVAARQELFETLIPARLDRMPWSEFHWLLVIGLGITWVLDGLEVTLMGAISAVLQRPDVLLRQPGDLPVRGRAHRLFVEPLELRAVQVYHRSRYRRRVLGSQLRH